jgi:Zn-dependent protease with chaperone function
MASDFFDREDHARRQTRRLLVMFTMAVAVIILLVYLLLAVATRDLATAHGTAPRWAPAPAAPSLWNPLLFLWVAGGTIVVIALGSLYKISELAAGGQSVALMLGGRPVDPQTTDLAERRLLNVVEEMALASGIPVPPVYVLEREPGINAFAAGHQPGDAVVAVSAGCLRYLTREELQGVMGHEFSHILNGDMRLNLRLIGIVFGILVLSVIGYYVMRSAGYFTSSRDSKGQGAGAAVAVFLLGLAFCVLGYLGVFLGKLIKSAISRQREFLADASSVQFTRLPAGITGALKKIGGLAEGSRIRDGHAEEISHMFFGDAFAGSFFNLFATHPPLAARIRAFEPDFDGHFGEVQPAAAALEPRAVRPAAALAPGGAAAGVAAMALGAAMAPPRVGRPQTEHLDHAGRLIGGMPQPLLDAARQPFTAQAVIFALLLSPDEEATRSRQLEILQAQIPPPLFQQVQQLAAAAQSLPAANRLPLVDLTVPALKMASPQQYAEFRQIVAALLAAEHKIGLFEYCLRIVLLGYLDVHFGLKKPPAIRYQTTAAVAQPLGIVLSTLANAGQNRPEDIQRAFQAGCQNLGWQLTLAPRPQCTLAAFDAALVELAQAALKVKRDVLAAATACLAAEGQVTLEESELLRAIAAALACPMPPMPAAGPGNEGSA